MNKPFLGLIIFAAVAFTIVMGWAMMSGHAAAPGHWDLKTVEFNLPTGYDMARTSEDKDQEKLVDAQRKLDLENLLAQGYEPFAVSNRQFDILGRGVPWNIQTIFLRKAGH